MLVDRHAPLLAHLFIGFMPLKGQRLIDWLSALRGLISYLFDSVIVSTHDAHDHFSCILGKVETIRNLDCIRSCFSRRDRKSTRLNSSHLVISYAVFCLKKKNTCNIAPPTPCNIAADCANLLCSTTSLACDYFCTDCVNKNKVCNPQTQFIDCPSTCVGV